MEGSEDPLDQSVEAEKRVQPGFQWVTVGLEIIKAQLGPLGTTSLPHTPHIAHY